MVNKIQLRSGAIGALAVAALWFGATAAAQPGAPAMGSPRWYFESVPLEAPADLVSAAGQRYVQALTNLGREDLVVGLAGRVGAPRACAAQALADETMVEHVARLADATSIVIVNEAHDTPRHREFTRQLAIALRGRGYVNFAAEAFSPRVERRDEEKFGRTDVGYSASEPTFGALLRTVKELGYTLVSYEVDSKPAAAGESMSDVIERREEGQANNLIDEVFRTAPRAKTLIHVGYSHAAEVPLDNFDRQVAWLAARLKTKTGIDPLTVDQTNCSTSGATPALAAAAPGVPAGAFDVIIAYPKPTFFRGRPRWRIDAGAMAIEMPAQLVDANRRAIIEARYASEPPDAVPLDRLLLRPGENLPLLLPVGQIRLLQIFEDGSPSRPITLTVR